MHDALPARGRIGTEGSIDQAAAVAEECFGSLSQLTLHIIRKELLS